MDKPRDARFQVSADRTSASRRVRYVETNQGEAGDCMLCQLDEGGVPIGEVAASLVGQQPQGEPVESMREEHVDDDAVGDELIQAIENQLSAQQPAAAQAVFNKLTLVGYEREDIVQMMAQVLAWQISEMLEADRAFDMDAYERALRALPQLPEGS